MIDTWRFAGLPKQCGFKWTHKRVEGTIRRKLEGEDNDSSRNAEKIIMAANPGLTKQELEKVLADSTFVADYRFSVHDYGDGQCTIYVPYQEKYVRPGGLVCGPVFMAAADMAMWLAIMTRLGRVEMAVTAEMKTSFLNGAKREDFYCHASTLKIGRRLIYGVAECVNGAGMLLTHHTFTYARPDR